MYTFVIYSTVRAPRIRDPSPIEKYGSFLTLCTIESDSMYNVLPYRMFFLTDLIFFFFYNLPVIYLQNKLYYVSFEKRKLSVFFLIETAYIIYIYLLSSGRKISACYLDLGEFILFKFRIGKYFRKTKL